MSHASTPSEHPPSTLVAIERLQGILDTQAEGYRRLLTSIDRQREAIRQADLESVPTIAEVQQKIVERLRILDERREVAGRELAIELGVDPESTLRSLVERLPAERGDRLSVRAAELRELVEKARHEQSVVKTAGDALARHMAGLVQRVAGTLSGTGVYGRRGMLRDGAPVVAGIDLTT